MFACSWHPSRIDFYLPVRALSKIFKAIFRDQMRAAGLLDTIPSDVWQTEWNVHCQAVGDSSAALKYLAPYVFKVALSNSRIIKVENRSVHLSLQKTGSQRWRTMVLDGIEFIRRFLQHVLPTGFMKIRYFGFMNANCNVDLNALRALITLHFDQTAAPQAELDPWQPLPCPQCGGKLRLCGIILPNGRLIAPS